MLADGLPNRGLAKGERLIRIERLFLIIGSGQRTDPTREHQRHEAK